MGQYYKCLTENKKDGKHIYSLQVDSWTKEREKPLENRDYGNYNGLKLLEHSWIGNSFMDSISNLIYKNPIRVAWVGDYADDFNWSSEIKDQRPDPRVLHKEVWKSEIEEEDIEYKKFDYKGKYLCNHTMGLAVNFDVYMGMCKDKYGECIHPLSLLTACGNGLGGGDYYEEFPDAYCVGVWCNDLISIEDKLPKGFTEVEYHFIAF